MVLPPPNLLALLLLLGIVVGGCNTSKYLGADEYVVRQNQIELAEGGEVQDWRSIRLELDNQVVTKPNGRFFFVAPREWFFLRLRDAADTSDFQRFVRRIIAEPPAFLDTAAVSQSRLRVRNFMLNRGYFDAEVNSSVDTFRKQFVKVDFEVTPGRPYTLDSIDYQTANPQIAELLQATRSERLLDPGQLTDSRVYDREVGRIVTLLRDNGFAGFYANSISPLEADSSGHSVRAALKVLPPGPGEIHQKYRIGRITVFPDNDPLSTVTTVGYDTTYDALRFIYQSDEIDVDPDALAANIFIRPGELFNQSAVTKTNLELNSLGLFRFVSLEQEVNPDDSLSIDFLIQLAPAPRWTIGQDADLTITDRPAGPDSRLNLVGGQVSGSIGNRNLLKGGERLNLSADAGLEFNIPQIGRGNGRALNTIELGTQAQLRIPIFKDFFGLYWGLNQLSLFGKGEDSTGFNLVNDGFYQSLREQGTTRLNLSARYTQILNFYTTTNLSGAFGYEVSLNSRDRYAIDHVGLEYFTVRSDSLFQSILERTPFLQRSFGDQVFSGFLLRRIALTHAYPTKGRRGGASVLLDLEQSGAEVLLINQIRNAATDKTSVFAIGNDLDYARYLRASLSTAYQRPVGVRSAVAARLLVGSAVTFGFADLERDVPYVRQFFGGGSQSMRGWRARSLGPGSYRDELGLSDTIDVAKYQQADFQLEANFEYRTFLTNISTVRLDGALFFDVGNIWTLKEDTSRPGSQFRLSAKRGSAGQVINDAFYRQLAVSSGVGLRLDIGYALLRLDLGVKLRNPYPIGREGEPASYWPRNFTDDAKSLKRLEAQIGLGYPF